MSLPSFRSIGLGRAEKMATPETDSMIRRRRRKRRRSLRRS
jgi:hypothetical protein